MNVLVVEDERNLADAICRILQDAGYNAEACYDGRSGLASARSDMYDAIVLDVMLPGMSGFEIVHELRRDRIATPVLMLTARTATTDKVEGLDAGADDYMTKPFAMKELLARIRSMTRRSTAFNPSRLTVGTLTLDIDEQELSAVHSIRLSGKEFQLMEYFMRNPGRAMKTEDLYARIWKDDPDADTEIVWLYISYLRKKLGAVMADVTIEGERGGSFTLR